MKDKAELEKVATLLRGMFRAQTGDTVGKVARAYDINAQHNGHAPVFCVLTKKEWKEVLSLTNNEQGR